MATRAARNRVGLVRPSKRRRLDDAALDATTKGGGSGKDRDKQADQPSGGKRKSRRVRFGELVGVPPVVMDAPKASEAVLTGREFVPRDGGSLVLDDPVAPIDPTKIPKFDPKKYKAAGIPVPRLADRKVYDAIVDAVLLGGHVDTAARAAGVTPEEVMSWLERGQCGENTLFYAFWRDMQQADAESELARLRAVVAAERKDWRAAMEVLSRRWPQRWSKRSEHVAVLGVTGKVTTEVKHDIAERILSDAGARQLARELLAGVPAVLDAGGTGDPSE